jgi:hypothetical protein
MKNTCYYYLNMYKRRLYLWWNSKTTRCESCEGTARLRFTLQDREKMMTNLCQLAGLKYFMKMGARGTGVV